VLELETVTKDLEPDIVILCETWCNSTTQNAALQLTNYDLQPDLRFDRTDTTNGIGGGLITYVRKGLEVLACDKISSFNQYSKFSIKNGDGEIFDIYLVYRPPRNDQQNIDAMCDLVKDLKPNSFLFGDFNLPGADWLTMEGDQMAEKFVQTCEEENLAQLVDFSTHTKGNILDLVITNNPGRVRSVDGVGRLGKSDHEMLLVEIEVNLHRKEDEGLVKNWKKADWAGICQGLEAEEWPKAEDEVSTEEAWQQLRGLLERLVDEFVPVSKIRPYNTPWMSREILVEVRKKRRLWKKVRNGVEGASEHYKEVEKKVKNMIRNAKRGLERKLANEKEKNSKPFYRYVKGKTKCRTTVGPLKDSQGTVVSDEREMAEQINEYFCTVFTREDLAAVPDPVPQKPKTRLTRTIVTAAKVRKKIKNLKLQSAPGPDGITPKILKECEKVISPILAMIYKKSLSRGEVPDDWKKANITPIYKKGSKAKACNYRPVSLTCVCCKMLESIIRDDLVEHLGRNKLVSPAQHGFMRNRSCTTNLLEYTEFLTKEADKGKSIDVVYLDYAKAFDKVPTERLLKKVEALGVHGEVFRWISAWLHDRKQRVIVRGKKSSWRDVLSGVPQGSVLGPVLFIMFINDLEMEAGAGQLMKMFADDTKIAQVVTTEEDKAKFQETIDRLCDWADRWGMAFNVDKCKIMHFGARNARSVYTMRGIPLESSDCERDIGVLISQDLKVSRQCKKAATTAGQVLNQILRAFHYRDRKTFAQLYKTYVRPHLEFAVAAWSPWSRSDIDVLENVQRKFVKNVSGLQSRDYEDKLRELGLPSLEDRRHEIDLIQVFKIVKGCDDVQSDQWFKMAAGEGRRPTRAAAGLYNLAAERSAHDYRRFTFSQRVVAGWNNLPNDLKAAPTPAVFKRQYRRHARMAAPNPGE